MILLAGVILVSGCTQPEHIGPGLPDEEPAKTACIKLCAINLELNLDGFGLDLSDGPCLSEKTTGWNIDDWVCDVAHSPRTAVDNLPENQCKDFREGRAHHFVEVGPDCEFIRAV